MRWILLLAVLPLTGCAVAYTAASTTTFVITDKTLTDHALTAITPRGDCNATHLLQGKYYCEIRDPATTYNRNPL